MVVFLGADDVVVDTEGLEGGLALGGAVPESLHLLGSPTQYRRRPRLVGGEVASRWVVVASVPGCDGVSQLSSLWG